MDREMSRQGVVSLVSEFHGLCLVEPDRARVCKKNLKRVFPPWRCLSSGRGTKVTKQDKSEGTPLLFTPWRPHTA